MEPFKFLDNKDQSFPSTNAGKRTIEWAKNNNFKIKNREDIWRAYMARIESVLLDDGEDSNANGESKSERALRLLKYKILKNNTLDLEDEEEVKKIAKGLYESEKKIAIERGMGGDMVNLDDDEAIDRYIENIKEKKEVQSNTLGLWINYISGPDCTLPTWFKYHAVRSLLAMGTKNVQKADYNKRASTTVSPYPEFNSEALGWVYKALCKELDVKGVVNDIIESKIEAGQDMSDEDKVAEAARIESAMSTDKFSKLFYFANLEVKGNLDRSFVEGEWVKYGQGSDHTLLEDSLKGKGTGWCTAEGSAAEQIESGDFYVYYSKNSKTGAYTEPRIAIRMNGDNQIAEVRGVNPGQEMEPQFADIVDSKMNDFGEGEAAKYKKKSSDMKTLTAICKKVDMDQDLTTDELRFIYEIDSDIEGFGYDIDPRIEEILSKRNYFTDMKSICTNKIMLDLLNRLEKENSHARPDLSYGPEGLLSLTIPPELKQKLSKHDTAIQAYEEADNSSPSWIWNELKTHGMPLTPLPDNLDIITLNFNNNEEIRKDPNKIIAEMDKLGLRPLTYSELLATAILRPEVNKRNEYLVSLGTVHTLGGVPLVPVLIWAGGKRFLGAGLFSVVWNDHDRFPCVRK